MNNDFLPLVRRFGNDFHSWLRHSWKSLPNRLTRDKKSLFTVTHALFFISWMVCKYLVRTHKSTLFHGYRSSCYSVASLMVAMGFNDQRRTLPEILSIYSFTWCHILVNQRLLLNDSVEPLDISPYLIIIHQPLPMGGKWLLHHNSRNLFDALGWLFCMGNKIGIELQ